MFILSVETDAEKKAKQQLKTSKKKEEEQTSSAVSCMFISLNLVLFYASS